MLGEKLFLFYEQNKTELIANFLSNKPDSIEKNTLKSKLKHTTNVDGEVLECLIFNLSKQIGIPLSVKVIDPGEKLFTQGVIMLKRIQDGNFTVFAQIDNRIEQIELKRQKIFETLSNLPLDGDEFAEYHNELSRLNTDYLTQKNTISVQDSHSLTSEKQLTSNVKLWLISMLGHFRYNTVGQLVDRDIQASKKQEPNLQELSPYYVSVATNLAGMLAGAAVGGPLV